MPPQPQLRIFLSYASEDSALTQSIENSLQFLSNNLGQGLKITRDIHSFQIGRSIQDNILKSLESTDILLIIYTEALKKSHSYTGIELGAFKMAMYKERKLTRKRERMIVSVYIDDPPDAEGGILNIKLDPKALNRGAEGADYLDPARGFAKFMFSTTDLVIDRSIKSDNKDALAQIKAEKHSFIEKAILPDLYKSLFSTLAGIMENGRIEQILFSVQWPPKSENLLDKEDILEDAELRPGQDDETAQERVFDIFGIQQNNAPIRWTEFISLLRKEQPQHAEFTINSIRDAVVSAMRAGPVDNEQVFLGAENKTYRIIVTRHYAFYDGSRSMNIYFIPFLARYSTESPSRLVAMVDLAVKFKSLVLLSLGTFSIESFDLIRDEHAKFRDLVVAFVRFFTLLDDESHAFGIDNKKLFRATFGVNASQVRGVFAKWYKAKSDILGIASTILKQKPGSVEMPALIDEWMPAFGTFVAETRGTNRLVGEEGAKRLVEFFSADQKALTPGGTKQASS